VRIRNILASLISAADMDGVEGLPGWRIHRLTAAGPEPGASARPATGGSPPTLRMGQSRTWIWRTTT